MNYIIDGHNLIAQIPGLDLSMPDDEERLIELLIRFCQPGKHRVEVYFDRAPVGQAGVVNHGRVRAHFVLQRSSADEAIHKRLSGTGKSVKNWVVVSSDRSVQAAAREARARVIPAVDFARLLLASPRSASTSPNSDEPLSEGQVRQWEAIFKSQPKPDKPG